MTPRPIPFNQPFVAGKELFYIADAVISGQISAGGKYTQRCEEFLQVFCSSQRCLLTSSCTAALELAALLCRLEPGDEVLVPSFTFVTTASAIVRAGGTPVFVDIDPTTLNIDPGDAARRVSDRTKAIFPIHYAGFPCPMDEVNEVAKAHDLLVVEDAAQALNAFYRSRPAGSLGDLAAFSFHETKNLLSGEGGALCINREDLVERAEILLHKGTNRAAFLAGAADKYTWVELGSSFVASEIVAAFLWAQLERLDEISARRRALFDRYWSELSVLTQSHSVQLPQWPTTVTGNGHLFYLILGSNEERNAFLDRLRGSSIHPTFHYVPLHDSPYSKERGYYRGALPVTEDVAARLVRLPLYYDLSREDQGRVIAATLEFFERQA